MFCRLTDIFKLCLNKKWSLRKQMMVSFLSVSGIVLLLALVVVLLTTFIVGDKAETEARQSLKDQIERHLTDASIEAAATIGERFRRIQYAVLDVTAFALKDALQEDLILESGAEGYPLSPAHTDLRETEVSDAAEDLGYFDRAGADVDLSRSAWYYSDGSSPTAEVDDTDDVIISNSARLDLLWPTMYFNSNDTDSIYVAVPFQNTSGSLFRMFPARSLSDEDGTLFSCSDPDEDGCYDPTVRPWYQAAVSEADFDESTGLGEAIITDPYIDASETDTSWLVTLARAVYDDDGESLLGVVGVDVRLEQVQLSVEGINFLTSGYSVLATAEEGNVVAAPDTIWDREVEEETDTLCNLESGICSGESGWEDLIVLTQDEVYDFTDDGGEGKKYILVTAPVQATFDLETGDGTTTHYILSAVPEAEVFEPVKGMEELIRASTTQIMVTTGIVALATLTAVAVAVCVVAGNITRPIKKMTDAAKSIAKDGAKTNIFGGVAADWGIGRDGDGSTRGSTGPRRVHTLDYLFCRGEDEIDTLVHEFSLMITGLGRRGKASTATGLEETTVYPKNPFTTSFQRAAPTAPSVEVKDDSSY